MTTGDYPPPDPNFPPPPPGGYPPPPPGYGPPTGYPVPQYGQPGGYPPPQPGAGQPGGLGVRFAARVIDGILVGILSFLLAFFIDMQTNIMVTGLFSGLLTFIYFVAFEVTQGWTPAKKLLGLSVHGPGGAPKPTVQQSAIRNSFTLLTVIPYIGGLLDIANGQRVAVGSFFKPRNVGAMVITTVIIGVLSAIGNFLCVIPGLLVALFTMFSLLAVVDRNLSPIDAIKASFEMVKNNFGVAILVWLLAAVITLVGALLCGVGLLVAAPVAYLFEIYAFRRLGGGQVAPVPA